MVDSCNLEDATDGSGNNVGDAIQLGTSSSWGYGRVVACQFQNLVSAIAIKGDAGGNNHQVELRGWSFGNISQLTDAGSFTTGYVYMEDYAGTGCERCEQPRRRSGDGRPAHRPDTRRHWEVPRRYRQQWELLQHSPIRLQGSSLRVNISGWRLTTFLPCESRVTDMDTTQTENRQKQGVLRAQSSILYLGLPLGVVVVLWYTYQTTHPYPVYGGGLFLEMSQQIANNGFVPPARITGYTPEGIPMAYPPLGFYVAAILTSIGAEPLALSRALPLIYIGLYTTVTYYFARDYFESKTAGSIATTLVGSCPAILWWHITAGGFIRSLAFLFVVCGLYAGLHYFNGYQVHWLAAATVSFAGVLLTHPVYSVFFVLTFIVLYESRDATAKGFVGSAIIGLGGLLLTSPWFLLVSLREGPLIYKHAAGTHGSIGFSLKAFINTLQAGKPAPPMVYWYVLGLTGAVYQIARDKYFFPAWFVVTGVFFSRPRFLGLITSLLATSLIVTVAIPRFTAVLDHLDVRTTGRTQLVAQATAVVIVVGAAITMGAGYTSPAGEDSFTMFYSEGDLAAMDWLEKNTKADATVLATGPVAEWIPYHTNRTIISSPWGAEWFSPENRKKWTRQYKQARGCRSAACLTSAVTLGAVIPDYVYISINTMSSKDVQALTQSLRDSPHYTIKHRTDTAIIVATHEFTANSTS